MKYEDFLTLIEVLGGLAFSMTGVFEARRLKRMRRFGLSMSTLITEAPPNGGRPVNTSMLP